MDLFEFENFDFPPSEVEHRQPVGWSWTSWAMSRYLSEFRDGSHVMSRCLLECRDGTRAMSWFVCSAWCAHELRDVISVLSWVIVER